MHAWLCGGHYAPRTIAAKIMRARYYWPTLFKDVHYFVRSCQECQFFLGKPRLPALPLNSIVVELPFNSGEWILWAIRSKLEEWIQVHFDMH